MAGALIGKVKRRMAARAHKRRFAASLRHLSGPKRADTPRDAVIVVVLVRDGMFFLDEFLNHYRGLGAAQFVFCDNGSRDGTIERLAEEPDCVVLQSHLPWGEVENDFRHYAAERYATGRWCLFADMDEIFVWDEGLPALARRLEAEGATALVAQMLEMVPKAPLAQTAEMSYAEALKAFEWYDLGDVTRYSYHDPAIGFSWYLDHNSLNDDAVHVMFGGLRKRVFGENCCLTKHPFVQVAEGVEAGVHPHAASGVKCASFTALIKHYKFAGDSVARDADTVARGAIPHGEDRARLAKFDQESALTLWSSEAERFKGLEPLYDAGFLLRPPERQS